MLLATLYPFLLILVLRKNVVNQFGFNKVYKQGLNISTPINIELQKIASESLRQGLIEYDKRKGWRGALTNKKYSKNWNYDLKKFDIKDWSNREYDFIMVARNTRQKGFLELENFFIHISNQYHM